MNLILAVTGATGACAAELLVRKSPWPVALVASEWGRAVYQRENGDFVALAARAARVFEDTDLQAPISSGSVPTLGMVILPCTTNTLAKVAHGIADTLITRAAHCHLKERRKLVLCVREAPWTSIDLANAAAVAAAGGTIMPLSPPFYQFAGKNPRDVSMADLLDSFVDRVLAVFGHPAPSNWETVA
jgi:4-hydroxy-3-polyprenylbenzoate decarboxylase